MVVEEVVVMVGEVRTVAATEVAVGAEAKVAVEVEVTEITIEVVVAAAELAEGDIIVAIDRIKRVHL